MRDVIQASHTAALAEFLREIEKGRLIYVHEHRGLDAARRAETDASFRSHHYRGGGFFDLAPDGKDFSCRYEFGNLYPSSPENVAKQGTPRGPNVFYRDAVVPCLNLRYDVDIDTGILLAHPKLRETGPGWDWRLGVAEIVVGYPLDDAGHDPLTPIEHFLQANRLHEFLPAARRFTDYLRRRIATRPGHAAIM